LEELIALAKVVNRQKVKQIDVITSDNPLSEKAKLFYNGLIDNRITSDEDALQLIYSDTKVSSKYRKLKNRLKQKLINTLFFIDVQTYSITEYQNQLVRGYLIMSAIQILISKGEKKAAVSLAEQALKNAIRFDLTEIVYFISTILYQHYTVFSYSKSKSQKYSKLDKLYAEYFQFEYYARRLFTYYGQFINQNVQFDVNKVPADVLDNVEKITRKLESIPTYYFNINARNALYFKAYLELDSDRMEIISREAIDYFKTKSGFSKIGEFSFLQKAGIANQALKRFDQAIEVYNMAYKLNPMIGGTAWFNIRNHLFNSHLHLKEYQKSYQYLLEATSNKKFRKLYDLYKEPWLIKEAYMHLLIKMGKVSEDKEAEQKLRPFRISRFLNEVEHFSKDKRGLNIAVHIVHVLHLFLRRQEDQLERRLDALNQYSFRYLRNDDTLRSNAFIKMLQKMPDSAYHPIKLQREADKYYQRLVAAPMIIAENSKEVEVIPYEHLWEIVIELLTLRHEGRI